MAAEIESFYEVYVVNEARQLVGRLQLRDLFLLAFFSTIGLSAKISRLKAGGKLLGLLVLLARKHKVWDPLHDGIYFAAALATAVLALWLNQDSILALQQMQ